MCRAERTVRFWLKVERLRKYLCIDAGFTQTRFAAANGADLLAVRATATIDTLAEGRRSPDWQQARWLEWLCQQIEVSRTEYGAVDMIGLCLPGPVGSDGVIAAANSLWGQATQPLRPAQISALAHCAVSVCNDLFATTTYYGNDPRLSDAETVMVVSVGSGIGSKLYDRRTNRVVSGQRGLNGEIGFSVVEYGDNAAQAQDGCITGTVGLYSSGTGFARMLRAEAASRPADFGASAVCQHLAAAKLEIGLADRYQINAAALAAIASEDDFAMQALRQSLRYLARALHVAVLFAAPDRLVITGGFALGIGPTYRRLLIKELALLLRPLHSFAALEEMVILGRSDGTDNLRGMVLYMGTLATNASIPASPDLDGLGPRHG